MSIKFAASELGVKPEMGVELLAHNKVSICLIFVYLLSVLLFGCSTKAPPEAIQATINITKIVDKASQMPINSNIVTLRWETPESKVIKTEQYRNQSEFSTTILQSLTRGIHSLLFFRIFR